MFINVLKYFNYKLKVQHFNLVETDVFVELKTKKFSLSQVKYLFCLVNLVFQSERVNYLTFFTKITYIN